MVNQTKYAAGNLWFIAYLWCFFSVYFLFNLIAYPFRKKINLVPLLMLVYCVTCFVFYYVPWNEKTVSFGHYLCKMFFEGHYHSYSFLFIGYFLRLTYDSFVSKAKVGWTVGALAMSLMCLCFLMVNFYGQDHYHWASAILFYGLLALFVLALFGKLRFFENPLFQSVGDASMWTYMIHENIGYLIINAFYATGGKTLPAYFIGLFWGVAFAFIAGWLLNKGYNGLLQGIFKKKPLAKKAA
jgi:peptidoglycan/LPS O-acetylase OafA/YrhL